MTHSNHKRNPDSEPLILRVNEISSEHQLASLDQRRLKLVIQSGSDDVLLKTLGARVVSVEEGSGPVRIVIMTLENSIEIAGVTWKHLRITGAFGEMSLEDAKAAYNQAKAQPASVSQSQVLSVGEYPGRIGVDGKRAGYFVSLVTEQAFGPVFHCSSCGCDIGFFHEDYTAQSERASGGLLVLCEKCSKCPDCGGSGSVSVPMRATSDYHRMHPSYRQEKCWTCGGTGRRLPVEPPTAKAERSTSNAVE